MTGMYALRVAWRDKKNIVHCQSQCQPWLPEWCSMQSIGPIS